MIFGEIDFIAKSEFFVFHLDNFEIPSCIFRELMKRKDWKLEAYCVLISEMFVAFHNFHRRREKKQTSFFDFIN